MLQFERGRPGDVNIEDAAMATIAPRQLDRLTACCEDLADNIRPVSQDARLDQTASPCGRVENPAQQIR